MTAMEIQVHLEEGGCFKDFRGKEIIHLGNLSPPIRIAALTKGTKGGRVSVAIGLDIGQGRVVLAETTLALFLNAADLLRAKFGDGT